MLTRTTDSKGRITLGEKFANRTVLVEEIDETEVRVTLARVVPEREAWLYDHPRALGQVRQGLQQARQGKLTAGPNLAKARKLAARATEDSE